MLRRTIGIGAAAAAVTIAGILPAAAQTSPGGLASYAAGARATAVDLTVFGQRFTVSETTAGIDSTAKAVADGHALLTPAGGTPGAPVSASTGGDPDSDEDCERIRIEPPIDLAAVDLVCVTTSAAVTDGNPASSATSNEVVIEVKASGLIGATPLTEVVGGIQDGLGQLFTELAGVTEPLAEETEIQLEEIVNGLLDEVQEGDTLVRITVAPTSSTSQFASGVVAAAKSNGVIVELLPNLPGGALAVATVGESTASVVVDPVTGVAKPDGAAAVLDITYPNGLLGGLEVLTRDLDEQVDIKIDQLACGEDNPLSPVICFTLGGTRELDQASAKALGLDFGENTVGQESSVLGLTLLSAAEGGIVLNVGHTAAAAGSAMPADPLPREDPLEELPLPRTGGDTAMPLTLALLAVGTVGAGLLRRSRTV